MPRKKKLIEIPAVVLPPGAGPEDYLEGMKREVLTRIYNLALVGKNEDATKLKALQTLLNKILPDKTRLDVSMKSEAPYEIITRAIKEVEDDYAIEKREKQQDSE